MASVTSRGIHRPSALDYAVSENILPPNPSPELYEWKCFPDRDGETNIEDELLVTKEVVVWSRGQVLCRTFNLSLENESITHAVITYFPQSRSIKRTTTPLPDTVLLSKALVVFLKTQAHVFFLNGPSHIVHLPFEVEAVCAAPQGVIIQRKPRADATSTVALKFPRLPPNSFVSSSLQSPVGDESTMSFSVEYLGKPPKLPLRTSMTLENMWQSPIETRESSWPRLLCLTDPYLDLGLIVQQPEAFSKEKKQQSRKGGNLFLGPAEEILHVEEIQSPTFHGAESLIIAVTVNYETLCYTVWRVSYIPQVDPFTNPGKRQRMVPEAIPRHSSFGPGFSSTTPTSPVQPSLRDTAKRALKGSKSTKQKDALLQTESSSSRKSRRRASSFVARADLSSSHDRSIFADAQSSTSSFPASATKRREAAKKKQAHNASSTHADSIGGHMESPIDSFFDDFRASGEFDGNFGLGLDRHDVDGLAQEISFHKIRTVSFESSKLSNSLSGSQRTGRKAKVFTLIAPRSTFDQHQRLQLLVAIQDMDECRLHLLTLLVGRKHTRKQSTTSSSSPFKAGMNPSYQNTVGGTSKTTKKAQDILTLSIGELRRAQGVADSCCVTDGDISMILIVSDRVQGGHEMSIQAPWSHLTAIHLPFLSSLKSSSVQSPYYKGRRHHFSRTRRTGDDEPFADGVVHGLQQSTYHGVVDLIDAKKQAHQVHIQLCPNHPHVHQILNACRLALPSGTGENMVSGWWHVMQWALEEKIETDNLEWTCLVILLLSMFMSLSREYVIKHVSNFPPTTIKRPTRLRRARSSSGLFQGPEAWDSMRYHESGCGGSLPGWMKSEAWNWASDVFSEELQPQVLRSSDLDYHSVYDHMQHAFLPLHTRHSQRYLSSSFGEAALGPSGYLPVATSQTLDNRQMAARQLFKVLHLIHEEHKLDVSMPLSLSPGQSELRIILCQIALWMSWGDAAQLYSLELPEDVWTTMENEPLMIDHDLTPPDTSFCVYGWIEASLTPSVKSDQGNSRNLQTLADIYYSISSATIPEQNWLDTSRWGTVTPRTLTFARFFHYLPQQPTFVDMVESMFYAGLHSRLIETLPEAIATPFRDAIAFCQPHPPLHWSSELLALVQRSDISLIRTETGRRRRQNFRNGPILYRPPSHTANWDFSFLCKTVEDVNGRGMEETEGNDRQAAIRALFREDRRLHEAQDLLATHRIRTVRFPPHPSWNDAEYFERQRDYVTRLAIATLAIPAGRGLIHYGLKYPILTQKLHIGGFNLQCYVRPSNMAIGVDKGLFTEEKVCWSFFHQGVAAGLAISPQAKGIDTSWILFNKPNHELSNRHAGFLLALGLNGHLKNMTKWIAFKYLTPKHSMTSIGLLLGLAASHLGTMDSVITRLLSIHVTRMLPRGAAELNLSPLTQTTGILGIGLLYCNSQHRRMSEIMLSEIEHVEDEEEEEEPLRSEGYRLAAGFALGLINLGKGTDVKLKGLHEMKLTEKLITIATSSKKVEIVQILDRAQASAIIALILIYMKSEDPIVARKVDVPDTVLPLDYIRPEILLLRILAKNLILWKQIGETREWVCQSMPPTFQQADRLAQVTKLQSLDLPYFNMLAGLCFAMGLRHAGSGNEEVRDTLVWFLDQFLRITTLRSHTRVQGGFEQITYDEEMARSSARSCQDLMALSASMVMAGTGDLIVLRRLRALHGREDMETPYGSHMAAHLAIGALFLGCGTVTFGTSNLAVASLLLAFYPIFPATVMDNRAHLQAFRHLWVLATEQRFLVVNDSMTHQPLNIRVAIRLKGDTTDTGLRREGKEVVKVTPCLLPSLDQIASVRTLAAPHYWDTELDFVANPHLASTFSRSQTLYLRNRPAQEASITSTLRTLGRKEVEFHNDSAPFLSDSPNNGAMVEHARRKQTNPMAWLFHLPAFYEDSTEAEREALLSLEFGHDGMQSAAIGSALDARLTLRKDVEGDSRDGLLGLRLLFSWAERREELRIYSEKGKPQKDQEVDRAEKETKKQKMKEQATDDDVSMKDGGLSDDSNDEGEDLDKNRERQKTMMDEIDDPWWIRRSVLEDLRGSLLLRHQQSVLEDGAADTGLV